MVRFYSSYILTSLDPRYANHTYIGFTNHPKRRIRQHNGLIKNGARMTKFKRPWEMVLLVHGFIDKRQALRFEAVWQKPQNCVLMKEVLKRLQFRSSLSLRVKIRYLFEMLQLNPWKNLPLTVQWLNDKYWNGEEKPTKWKTPITQNCPTPPPHIKMMVAPLESLEVYNKDSDQSDNENEENSSDQSNSLLSDSNLSDSFDSSFVKDTSLLTQSLEPCSICDQEIFYHQDPACCPHFSCSAKTHLQCLSEWFLKDSPNLLPTYGFCPVCSAPHSWSDAINTKTSTTTPTKHPKNNTTYSPFTPSHSTLSMNSTLSSNSNNNNATLVSPSFSSTTTTHSNLYSSSSQKFNKKRQPLSLIPILNNSNYSNNNYNYIETTPPQKRTKNNASPSFSNPPQNTTTSQKSSTLHFPSIFSSTTNNMHTPNHTQKTRFKVKDVGNNETILIDDENENESDNDDFLQSGLFD